MHQKGQAHETGHAIRQPRVHSGHWLSMDPRITYGIAQLRFEVFTMGQGISDTPDLDGLDLEESTTTFWISDHEEPVCTLRTLARPGEQVAIGRVATSPRYRGQGLAGLLLASAIAEYPGRIINIHAQAYLEHWYERFGFRRTGPNFDEAGIPHAPMSLVPHDAGI
ncbi:GNAT family N-acetyltransferase [Kocuria massiliensis]|uniref:GNAT family N-acetyltransferase n=1 Tax=Kocuria massiliensis TaxID=1926282 RepID=UPI0022B96EBF|nr:GNAT family N-acetyltransferase [Kocuria massiliensis]